MGKISDVKSSLKKIFESLLYSKPKKILGIEFSDLEQVKIVQIEFKNNKKPLITKFVVEAFPEELLGADYEENSEDITFFLKSVLKKNGFDAEYVAFAIMGKDAFVRKIALPQMDDSELQEAVIWESSEYVPYEKDTYYVDFDKFSKIDDEGLQPLILVAAPKERIDFLLNIANKLELKTLKIDVDVVAAYRTLSKEYENFIMLSVEKRYSLLTIFQDGAPVAQRSVSQGLNSFLMTISDKMLVDLKEARNLLKEYDVLEGRNGEIDETTLALRARADDLIRECRRTSEYYKVNNKDAVFDQVVIVGDSYDIKGLDKYLSKNLDMLAFHDDLLEKVEFENYKSDFDFAQLVVPIGAALGGGEN